MLSQIIVLVVASGNISVVNSVHFSVLYIVTAYIFCCITPDYGAAYADTILKMSTSEQRGHVVYSSGFPIG